MERESVLSFDAVKELFNHFFRDSWRLLDDNVLDAWMSACPAPLTLFGIARGRYDSLNTNDKRNARSNGRKQLIARFREVVQRRNDCIHNCDRPKTKPQRIPTLTTVKRVLDDVQFLVGRCDGHIVQEFDHYLSGLGCDLTTRGQLRY